MGSDDGEKKRREASYSSLLFTVVVVSALLVVYRRYTPRNTLRGTDNRNPSVVVQQASAQATTSPSPARHPEATPSERRGEQQQQPPEQQQQQQTAVLLPATTPPERSSSRCPPPGKSTRLRTQLVEIVASHAPAEAVRILDEEDPLGVADVPNASAWRCPADIRERLLAPRRCEAVSPSRAAERAVRAAAPGAFLWFEHLSKAGGTSFCKFARQNVGFANTPRYYCMPSDGAAIAGTDGRVGRWPAGDLRAYVRRTRHLVLANEWDAFPRDVLLDGDDAPFKNKNNATRQVPNKQDTSFRDSVVLATIVRDPVDRLVSAYKFWGVLHNPRKPPPEMAEWLRRKDAEARRRPHRRFKDDFLSQVARSNFATWKFASHRDPARYDDCRGDATCELDALNLALDALSAFHVAVPTTWQAAAAPLYRRLGWTQLDEIHVVPSGAKQNSNARDELSQADFDELRRNNVFDLALFHWVRRAFLERLHCDTLDEDFDESSRSRLDGERPSSSSSAAR